MPAIAATTEPAAFVLRSVDGRLVIAKVVVVADEEVLFVTVKLLKFALDAEKLSVERFVENKLVDVAFVEVEFPVIETLPGNT